MRRSADYIIASVRTVPDVVIAVIDYSAVHMSDCSCREDSYPIAIIVRTVRPIE